jgi:hypothetical protein
VQKQLLLERESSGKIQLSQIETESLMHVLVGRELDARAKEGKYVGKFGPVTNFFGYQARCAMPSNFDCDLGYTLGAAAAALTSAGLTGRVVTASNLNAPVDQWKLYGVPLHALLSTLESDETTQVRPIVVPSDVDLKSPAFKALKESRPTRQSNDARRNPGPVQFFGAHSDARTQTLQVSGLSYLTQIADMQKTLEQLSKLCRPGCAPSFIQAASGSLKNLVNILEVMRKD